MNKPRPDLKAAEAAARASFQRNPEALTKYGSRKHWLEIEQIRALVPQEREGVALRALAGDAASQQAIREMAANEIAERPQAGAAAKFIAAVLLGRVSPRRGPQRSANYSRDFRIALAVYEACEAGGLNATRNETSEADCGCSVVVNVLREDYGLRLKYDSVESIWERYSCLR